MCSDCDEAAAGAGVALDNLMEQAKNVCDNNTEFSAAQMVGFVAGSIMEEFVHDPAGRGVMGYVGDLTMILSCAVARLNAVQDIHGVSFK